MEEVSIHIESNQILKKNKLSCFEQEVCNISYLQAKQKIKNTEFYMKLHQQKWIAADFEGMNVPWEPTSENDVRNANCTQSLHDNFVEKLFVNKPFALGYNIFKKSYCCNLSLEKKDKSNFLVKNVLNVL